MDLVLDRVGNETEAPASSARGEAEEAARGRLVSRAVRQAQEGDRDALAFRASSIVVENASLVSAVEPLDGKRVHPVRPHRLQLLQAHLRLFVALLHNTLQ